MAKIDDIEVEIKADASGVKKGTSEATKAVNSFAKNTNSAMSKVSAGTVAAGNLIAKAISATFSAMASNMGAAIKRVDTLNNFPRVMQNMGISSETAQKAINYLQDKLQGLPTTLDDAASAIQRFTAANGNLEASTKMFEGVNNMLLASGQSMDKQASALEQLSQAYTKGKPEMQDWKTLLQTIPGQLNQVAQAMGYVDSRALYDAFQNGDANMNDFMKTVVKLNKEGVNGFASFEEQAAGSTNGIQTSITNLKTAITRGMANIVDAIGQSNIAGFFKGVASAVSTAANYVAAFVRVVLTAINAIRAIFGQSVVQFGKTASSADSAAASVGGVSDAAQDATKDINGTTGAAKKLAKQLAGFDEMNVLKEPDSDSGSGSGGASAGGASLAGLDLGSLDFGEITDPIQEAYNKLMSMFGKLDLSKWHKALRNFAKGANNYIEIVKKNWTSAWDNMFKPLAKYVAENTLPDFLNGIGEALQRLNPESFGKGFDNFYKGLEKTFEGVLDIVVSVSNTLSGFFAVLGNLVIPPALSILGTIFQTIGEVLKGIGEGVQFIWVEELQPALDAFAQAFQPIIEHIQGVMAAISECTPLMEFFKGVGQAIGIVVGAAFELVADAIMIVVGVILIVIDYFISLGEWVGEVCSNIGQFFADLGTNINNIWTGVCNWIKSVFEPIGKWFEGVFNGVKEVFTNAWNFLKTGAQGAWNAIKSIFSNVASFFGTIFTNAWTAVKNVFSTGGKIFMGIVDGVANAFKTIVNAIITGINAVVAVPFNAINGILRGVHDINILGVQPFGWVGTISVPQIPKLAKGGIVDRTTIAMIGEQGKEAIVPLENNTTWIDKLSNEIAEKTGSEPVHVTVKIGEDTLIDKVIEGINESAFLANRGVINI